MNRPKGVSAEAWRETVLACVQPALQRAQRALTDATPAYVLAAIIGELIQSIRHLLTVIDEQEQGHGQVPRQRPDSEPTSG